MSVLAPCILDSRHLFFCLFLWQVRSVFILGCDRSTSANAPRALYNGGHLHRPASPGSLRPSSSSTWRYPSLLCCPDAPVMLLPRCDRGAEVQPGLQWVAAGKAHAILGRTDGPQMVTVQGQTLTLKPTERQEAFCKLCHRRNWRRTSISGRNSSRKR